MLIFCDFNQVFVFTTNHYLKLNTGIPASHLPTMFVEMFVLLYLFTYVLNKARDKINA